MTPPPARRPDASMSLLTEVTTHPLDPGYREAADRRAAAGGVTRHRRGGTVAVALLAVGLGVLTTWSVIQLRAPQPSALAAREVLASQIRERSAELDDLRSRSAALADEVADLQEDALAGEDSSLLDQLARDSLVSGAVAVQGEGLRVTLTDADVDDADADPDSRVRDSDLQVVVNGLWAAGAEAIAVNGERLSATTAIRTAGSAILVDVVPLIGPYRVEAVGDPQAMQAGLARTSAGQLLAVLQSTYGIRTEVSSQRDLRLPAAPAPHLHSAVVPEGVPVGPGATPPPSAAAAPSGTLSTGRDHLAAPGGPSATDRQGV